jgi:magnesium chelatase subunit H
MDSHLSGAVTRAEAKLKQEHPGLHLVIHAADEWGNDADALAACKADIARGDIIVTTMLFLDDHIRAVLPDLTARRDHCDAMLCCVSAGEVTRLTKLGKFDMSAEATGALALLKRLKPKRSSDGTSAAGKDQMKMLRRLPKLMKYIPGTAQDVRTYFLALQYWLAGSEENLGNMVRMLVDRYAAPTRRPTTGIRKAAAPVEYPDVGLYHPRLTQTVTESVGDLPVQGERGTVGLLLLRSYVLSGNARHYAGVIGKLEAQGLRVIPAFSSGLDQRPAIDKYFVRDGIPAVDAVLSLTGFSLVGGPAYNDARAAEEVLAKLDVPYITAHPVEFQTLENWQADPRGLTPVEATIMVAIPELDGGVVPMTFGGRCGKSQTANPCPGCDGQTCSRDMVARTRRNARGPGRKAGNAAPHRPCRQEDRFGDL